LFGEGGSRLVHPAAGERAIKRSVLRI
jgi:hypothetical protein